MNYIVMNEDGSTSAGTLKSLVEIYAVVGCRYVTMLMAREEWTLYADEEGLLQTPNELNKHFKTKLIVGKVILVKENEEGVFMNFTEEEGQREVAQFVA